MPGSGIYAGTGAMQPDDAKAYGLETEAASNDGAESLSLDALNPKLITYRRTTVAALSQPETPVAGSPIRAEDLAKPNLSTDLAGPRGRAA